MDKTELQHLPLSNLLQHYLVIIDCGYVSIFSYDGWVWWMWFMNQSIELFVGGISSGTTARSTGDSQLLSYLSAMLIVG